MDGCYIYVTKCTGGGPSGVTESLFGGGGGAKGRCRPSLGGGGLDDGIAIIFSPSHLLCTIKSQMGRGANGGGGGHGVNGGVCPPGPP